MIDEREVREMLQRRADAVSATPVDTPTAVRRARRRLVLNGSVTTVVVTAIALATFAAFGATREAQIPADPAPTPMPAVVWPQVHARDTSVVSNEGAGWRDPRDAPVKWIDVRRVFTRTVGDGYWTIVLAARPPRGADIESGLLIAYGLVLDTDADGVADYLIGIDNDTPRQGYFHVWLTDLSTGETHDKDAPPYGFPVEFSHPDEWRPRDGWSIPTMTFTFLPGTTPEDMDPKTVRFYAWASAARDGEVFALDYAPNDGWMTRG